LWDRPDQLEQLDHLVLKARQVFRASLERQAITEQLEELGLLDQLDSLVR